MTARRPPVDRELLAVLAVLVGSLGLFLWLALANGCAGAAGAGQPSGPLEDTGDWDGPECRRERLWPSDEETTA